MLKINGIRTKWIAMMLAVMIAMSPAGVVAHGDLPSPHIDKIDLTGGSNHFKAGDVIELIAMFDVDVSCSDAGFMFRYDDLDEYLTVMWAEGDGNDPRFQTFRYTVTGNELNGTYFLKDFNPWNCDDGTNPFNPLIDMDYFLGRFPGGIVIDTVKPSIVSAVMTKTSQSIFKEGDVLPFEVTFSEPMQDAVGSSILLNNGARATYKGKKNDQTLLFEYVVQAGDDYAGLDTVKLEGAALTDAAGNPLMTANWTLNPNPEWIVDTIAPEVSVDKPGIAAYAKTHDIQLEISDRDAAPKVFYTWTASPTPPAPASIDGTGAANGNFLPQPGGVSGSYYVHLKVTDDAGNQTIETFGPYYFDNAPPTVTFDPTEAMSNESINITVQAADAHSGVKQLAYKWQGATGDPTVVAGSVATVQTPPNDDGHVLEVTVTDNAGNEATYTSGTYAIDTTPPEVAFSSEGNANPAQQHQVDVEVTGRAGESGQVYVLWTDSYDFPSDAHPDWKLLHNGVYPATITTASPGGVDGTWYVHVRATDSTGNTRKKTTSNGFVVDNTSPEVLFHPEGNNGMYASNVEVRLEIDGKIADLDDYTIVYRISEEEEPDEAHDDWLPSSDGKIVLEGLSGHYYVHVKVTDAAGNTTTASSKSFALDDVSPSGSAQFSKTHTNVKEVLLLLDADDNMGVNDLVFAYSWNGEDWSDWLDYRETMDVALEGDHEGEHRLHVKFRDRAGNVSDEYHATIIYDVTPPEFDFHTLSPSDWTQDDVTVTIHFTDTWSQADPVTVVFDQNGTYTVEFADLAGNKNSTVITIDNIDRKQPDVGLSVNGSVQKRQSVSTEFLVSDNSNAAVRVEYAWSESQTVVPTSWTLWEEADGPVTLSEKDGIWYLWVKAQDQAGNERMFTSAPFLLDNTPPTAVISYSPSSRTANPVTAHITIDEEATVIKPESGAPEYTFKENGTYMFEFVDEAGNIGTATAVVDWIDDSLPGAHVTMTPNTWTNGNVEVTVHVNDHPPRKLLGIHAPEHAELIRLVTAEHGEVNEPVADATVTEVVYLFKHNGTLTFTVVDLDTELESTIDIIVDQIDRTPPTAELIYSHTSWTNTDVTVTLLPQDESGAVTVIGSNTYTFTKNGTHKFEFRDAAGNVSEKIAVVDFIDKEEPNPVITFSTDSWTQDVVTAEMTFDNESEPVRILNHDGATTYTFQENGSVTVRYEDIAGNRGETTITVDWIDREAPTGTLLYSESGWTNNDVLVTLLAGDNSGAPLIFLNEGGNERLFTENGSFTFEVMDQAGNVTTFTAVVDRIDKTAPTAEVYYSVTNPTNSTVRATISPSEPVTVLNNGGRTYYDFTDNDSFTFEIRDRAGNVSYVTAKVDWIDKEPPVAHVGYSTTLPTNQDVVAAVTANEPFFVVNNYGSPQYVFKENGGFVFVIQDAAGNTTEIIASVTNIDKSKPEFTLNYSETAPTTANVTVTVTADRPVTILNNNGSSTVTFESNGVFWLEVMDAFDEVHLLPITVNNIDKVKPEIRFLQGNQLLAEKGTAVDPLADVQAIDNMDGDLTAKVEVTHEIDPSQPGRYTVTYRVMDSAGNETIAERSALIIDPNGLSVFVNSENADSGELMLRASQLSVQHFGHLGGVEIRWAQGKRSLGDFKMNRNRLSDGPLSVDKQDYYTLLIEDQERQYKIIHVYVIPVR